MIFCFLSYILLNPIVSKLVYIRILSSFFRICYKFNMTGTIEKRVDENKENCKQQM